MVKLAIDCDGVIFDFTKRFVQVINEVESKHRLVPWKDIPLDYAPPKWSWPDLFGPGVENRAWDAMRKIENFWVSLNPLPGAAAVKKFIHDPWVITRDIEIYFVTARARGDGLGRSVASQTRQCIETHIGWNSNWNVITVGSGDDKAQLYDAMGVKYSIDDRDKTVEGIFNYRRPDKKPFYHRPFLLDQSWNRDAHQLDHLRVNSVAEYLDEIKKREGIGRS